MKINLEMQKKQFQRKNIRYKTKKLLSKKKILLLFFLISVATISASSVDRPKIGLVLSGGGAKGFAHIGTLKMLDSLQIPIDYITGTSMGGIVGALYAIGYDAAELEKLALGNDWQEVFTDLPSRVFLPFFQKKDTGKYQLEFDLKGFQPVPPSSLIRGQKVSLLFSKLTFPFEHISDFDNLPISFRCVAVDLVSGREVTLKRGSLAKAMRATMTIPSIFSPVEWGDSLLIDGGLLNNLPVDVIREMGADIVIAVNVGAPMKKRKELQSLLDILEQSITIPGYIREDENVKQADILICPQLEGFSSADFDKAAIRMIINQGNLAAHESLSKLIQLKETYHLVKHIESLSDLQLTTEKPQIHGISIVGNEKLPFQFIYRLLGFKPGESFDTIKLEERITELYSLGYFETIHYKIELVTEKSVRLILNVKERRLGKLRIGLRYDNFHQLVAAVSLQGTNIFIPGLRLESELQFAGLTRFRYKFFYPSRTLDFPVYPFLRFDYKNIPINIFDLEGEKIASYQDCSTTVGLGLGFLLGKFWNVEAEYHLEVMNIEPDIAYRDIELFPTWKDRLRKVQLSFRLDFLDDVLLPREGVFIQANYEGSFKSLGSNIDYTRMEISANIYHTFNRRHTGRFFAFWGKGTRDLPVYKFFYKGGPEEFVGMEYNQLAGNKMSILRFDYRYEHKKDIFIKLIVNAALNYINRFQSFPINSKIIWGYGIGVKFLSPVGPLQFIFSRGEKSAYEHEEKRNIFYFTAGYKF